MALDTKYKEFVKDISSVVSLDRIYDDDLRLLTWGTDAGFYRLLPKLVIRAKDEREIITILKSASKHKLPVTFRAAGTSLSGQAITDSILVVAGKNWENYRILDNGQAIALQPGIIGGRVNAILQPYHRIFSPDPASKNSAMVGGIVINNASGMNCGTHANSDRILKSIRIVLADGTLLDTSDEMSRNSFRETHSSLVNEIESIRDEIREDAELTELIRHKYSIKNVTGLNLLPFVLYDNPFDIIAHSMVGSEGTLAFLSEVTVNTAPKHDFTASAMVYFKDIAEACRAVVAMKRNAPVYSCELLDKKSLASVNDKTGVGLTALLIETQADSELQLNENVETILKVISEFDLYKPAQFSADPEVTAAWWQMRSGVFPAVGGTRPLGTTSLIEDIAFHIEDLPTATVKLEKLLIDCGYDDACIYGHALEGNYHFVIAQSFETQEDINRYKNLMLSIEHLVVDEYKGSLKAEHGTGRNMAPFVVKEWGEKAFMMMKRVKAAFDPNDILNPGVIFNDDPECYIKGMKPLPLTNPRVDRCIECGFCEVNCVSCGLTLSARQRIIARREISRLKADGSDSARLVRLTEQFKYYGNETCAGDGLCSTSCPMKINTGEMIHDIRQNQLPNDSTGYQVGKWAANNLGGITAGLRYVLSAANVAHRILGDARVNAIGKTLHNVGVPLWSSALPNAVYPSKSFKLSQQGFERNVVYLPSCINRTMGVTEEPGKKIDALIDVMVRLFNKAGYEVIYPDNIEQLCCGMIWETKGMPDIADQKIAQLRAELLKASENGEYPIVCDQSPCLHRMREKMPDLKLYEPAEFIHDFLAPRLEFHPIDAPIAVHITCSTRRMGIASKLIEVASMCSTSVTVPAEVGCCGFAGDKGFTTPELNEWGLRKLRPALEMAGVTAGYSNSRTCEIGLTRNSGIYYKSIAYLVDSCTTKKENI
jgi:D-lactate dehydrogenase